MPKRVDPYANFNFIVEIDGVARGGFSECFGLEVGIDVIEYREGWDPSNAVRKIPGLIKYSPIVLKRGITQDKALWNWIKKVLDGKVQRANGSIALLDTARIEVLRWNFREGWPSKWEGPTLNGKSSDIAIETMVIEHEGIELVV